MVKAFVFEKNGKKDYEGDVSDGKRMVKVFCITKMTTIQKSTKAIGPKAYHMVKAFIIMTIPTIQKCTKASEHKWHGKGIFTTQMARKSTKAMFPIQYESHGLGISYFLQEKVRRRCFRWQTKMAR